MNEKNSPILKGLCYDSDSSTKKQLKELFKGGTYKDNSVQGNNFYQITSTILKLKYHTELSIFSKNTALAIDTVRS